MFLHILAEVVIMPTLAQTLARIKKLEEKFKAKPPKYEILLDFDNDPSMSKAMRDFDARYPDDREAEAWLIRELSRAILAACEADIAEQGQ